MTQIINVRQLKFIRCRLFVALECSHGKLLVNFMNYGSLKVLPNN